MSEKRISPISKILHEIRYFLTSTIFLKNIGLILLSAIVLFFILNISLSLYTNHGKSVQVGNYIGLEVETATKQAGQSEMSVVVADSVWNRDARPGTIKDQTPLPNARVKENREINLIIYKYFDYEDLPKLKGNYDYERYKRSLSRFDFDLEIAKKVFDPKQAPNTILYLLLDGKKITEDDIEKGINLAKGTMLQAVVTKSTSDYVPVPDLHCLRYSEATFIIQTALLNVGDLEGVLVVTENSYVAAQEPAFGQSIRVGEMINLTLSDEKPSLCP